MSYAIIHNHSKSFFLSIPHTQNYRSIYVWCIDKFVWYTCELNFSDQVFHIGLLLYYIWSYWPDASVMLPLCTHRVCLFMCSKFYRKQFSKLKSDFRLKQSFEQYSEILANVTEFRIIFEVLKWSVGKQTHRYSI